MAKYTVRITNDDDGIKAWIDQDGQICICQTAAPGNPEQWATEAEAKKWADQHAAELEMHYEKSLADAARKKEMEEAAHAANLASIETAKALQALVAHLANPTA